MPLMGQRQQDSSAQLLTEERAFVLFHVLLCDKSSGFQGPSWGSCSLCYSTGKTGKTNHLSPEPREDSGTKPTTCSFCAEDSPAILPLPMVGGQELPGLLLSGKERKGWGRQTGKQTDQAYQA